MTPTPQQEQENRDVAALQAFKAPKDAQPFDYWMAACAYARLSQLASVEALEKEVARLTKDSADGKSTGISETDQAMVKDYLERGRRITALEAQVVGLREKVAFLKSCCLSGEQLNPEDIDDIRSVLTAESFAGKCVVSIDALAALQDSDDQLSAIAGKLEPPVDECTVAERVADRLAELEADRRRLEWAFQEPRHIWKENGRWFNAKTEPQDTFRAAIDAAMAAKEGIAPQELPHA